MLNISENSIHGSIQQENFSSFKVLRKIRFKRFTVYLLLVLLFGLFLFLFLPWTQNVQAKGYVTTRSPEQRPQSIQSVISGRLEKWYVQEGDFVAAGDTIVFISEVKSEYFDNNLIARTSEQVDAKSQSVESYADKVKALQSQYAALQASRNFKLEQTQNKILQARNKINIDSTDLIALEANFQIAENQLSRTKELYSKGLKSLTEFQEKELKIQALRAKINSQKNKFLNQKNQLGNLIIELTSIEKDYLDKLSKSQSDKQSALSNKLESVAATSKLQNQLSNYKERQKFYHLTAPQSGYITKALKKGIGEIIKEGVAVATIMPSEYDLAIEIYLRPFDLPLISLGNQVRLRFDGWPAIVVSGWPESSTGIFSGEVVAIDQSISDNGFYRLLISPDDNEKGWPEKLRVGTGANAFVLLKDVPIWYEIWRQLNGFPPDYYQKETETKKEIKRKAPLKSVK